MYVFNICVQYMCIYIMPSATQVGEILETAKDWNALAAELASSAASLNLKASTMEELAKEQIPVLGELTEMGKKCVDVMPSAKQVGEILATAKTMASSNERILVKLEGIGSALDALTSQAAADKKLSTKNDVEVTSVPLVEVEDDTKAFPVMQIAVKFRSMNEDFCKTITLKVKKSDTIGDVKKQIRAIAGLHPYEQKLSVERKRIRGGKLCMVSDRSDPPSLHDKCTLAGYGISEGSSYF